jgi:nitrate/nitrite-specific signal transduction histidine kinase
MNDVKDTIKLIPKKIENIIINNIADNNGKETLFFREVAAILFEPIQLNYKLNIINESMWNTVNEFTQKHVFLIYKEILVNIIRHSKASFVVIDIEVQKNKLTLLIKDNGVGFDTSENKKGYGLYSIKRRVERLKGNISINSAKNAGCSIGISI